MSISKKPAKESPYPMIFNTSRDGDLREDLMQFAFEDDCSLAKLVRRIMREYRNKRKLEISIINSRKNKK